MRYSLKNLHLYIILCIDLIIFGLAISLAYLIRFDFSPHPSAWEQLLTILPYVLGAKTLVFAAFGMYNGMWRYTNLHDSWRLAQACIASQALLIAVLAALFHFQGFSRGVFAIDLALTFVLTGGVRVSIRTYFLKKGHLKNPFFRRRDIHTRVDSPSRCLVVGAGNTGEKVLREVLENHDILYNIVGFLDDDKNKVGRTLHGVRVLGTVDILTTVVGKKKVDEVLIAMPSASAAQMRRVVKQCEQARVKFKTLPGIGEIIDGRVSISMFREVNLNDLLGRKQVELNFSSIISYLQDKVIMVTGAGGSIGSELIRQVVRFQPAAVILVEHGESALYAIQMELKHEFQFCNYVTVLGRVQDRMLMEQVFTDYTPHVVFHAAAYKHVPMLERNPWEAVLNNVIGSMVVMETALKWNVKRFVLVSTDKAVRPTNVMGASKRVTELLMQGMPKGQTKFMAVRFGNVLGSSGSVIPLFQRQIKKGGPVTVTHPDITRYFMTIPEACQLIVQAGGMGLGGEIFVLNMGKPVRIADMARDLIMLSGLEPDVDIEVRYTGIRDGEKLYEDLITQDEGVVMTAHKDILVLRPADDPKAPAQDQYEFLLEQIQALLQASLRLDGDYIKLLLHQIVPEYTISDCEMVVQALPENKNRMQLAG